MKNILSNQSRIYLAERRSTARAGASLVVVPEHTRRYARLQETKAQRLARWEDVEDAVRRLAKHREKNGPCAGDKRSAQQLTELLHDVFGVEPTS